MRRSILVATSGLALAAAMAAGPFGAAGAAPYVYGCTPATLTAGANYSVDLDIYNGSASAASVTMKLLAGNGTILFAQVIPIPATHTASLNYLTSGSTSESSSSITSTVRLVSNVPLSATLTHVRSATESVIVDCKPLQP